MLKKMTLIGLSLMLLVSTTLFAQSPLDKAKTFILNEKFLAAQGELDGLIQKIPSEKALQKVEDEIYYWRGKVSLISERFAEAKTYFEKGIAAAKKSPMNKAGLARVAVQEGNIEQAKNLLGAARDMNHNKDPFADFEIAEAYLEGDADMRGSGNVILLKYTEGGSLTCPKGSEAIPYILTGKYYKKQSVIELGIEALEKALEISPNYVPAIAALAELYYDQGSESKKADDFNTALRRANEAIEKDADYAPAYRIRAEIKLLLKEFEAARDDMEKYVSETQGDLKARERYAAFLYLSGNYQESINEITEINQAGLNTQVLRRLKGLALIQLGKLDEAETAMNTYFKGLSSEDFAIATDYEAMGDIYRLKGDLAKSDEFYGKMVIKNPDRADKYESLADSYQDSAKYYKKLEKEMKVGLKAKQGEIASAREAYNACAQAGNQACADSLKPIYEGLIEEAQQIVNVKYPALENKEDSFYPNEVHYRKKAIEVTSESLRRVQKLAIAQYNAKMYLAADSTFKRIHTLDDNLPAEQQPYALPYNYRFQIAGKLDTDEDKTYTKIVGNDVYNDFKEKSADVLKSSEKRLVSAAMGQLIQTTFDAEMNDGNGGYDCEVACPYIDRFLEIAPENEDVAGLRDYCKCGEGR